MKKILFILLSIICVNLLNAQVQVGENGFGFKDPNKMERPTDMDTKTDSTRLSIKPVIKKWFYSNDGVYKILIPRDTSIDQNHNFNPIFQKSISNTYLGNLCSPYIENIFIKRDTKTDYLFIKALDAYMFRHDNQANFNTTTPYTDITFKTGGKKRQGETLLRVHHTQNISPFWNVGLKFNLTQGDGQYTHQKSKIYDFSVFSTYEKERFAGYWFINQNVGKIEENGGITEATFIRDTSIDARNIPVNLIYPETKFYNFNLYSCNQYNLGKKKEIIKGKDTVAFFPIKIVYTLKAEENERKFSEETITEGFFENNFNEEFTKDKSFYSFFDNDFKFVWNKNPESIRPGLFVGISNKAQKYGYQTENINDRLSFKKFNTQYISSGMFHQDSAKFNYDIKLKYAISGEYQGDIEANGIIKWNLSRNNTIVFSASYKDKAPDFFFNQFYSNHYKWTNNFNSEINIQSGIKLINNKRNLEIGLIANKIKNYIYFNTQSLPNQSSKDIDVFTAYINKDFTLGKLHFNQTVYYQKSRYNTILTLPEISVYSNNYFKDWFFDNALQFLAGVDIYYNSDFFAPRYNPATTTFYNQREEKFGDFPKVDLFINFRIKRALLFFKYEHINFHFGSKDYFTTSYYPINPAMFKYGVRWYFYD